jgi:hypothetical protein
VSENPVLAASSRERGVMVGAAAAAINEADNRMKASNREVKRHTAESVMRILIISGEQLEKERV